MQVMSDHLHLMSMGLASHFFDWGAYWGQVRMACDASLGIDHMEGPDKFNFSLKGEGHLLCKLKPCGCLLAARLMCNRS